MAWPTASSTSPMSCERLEHEGIDNLRALIAFTREHGIDCDLEETGTLGTRRPALPGRRVPGLGRRGRRARRAPRVPRPRRGPRRGPLAAVACRSVPAAGARHPRSTRRSCVAASRGSRASGACRIHEGTRVTSLRASRRGVDVRTAPAPACRGGPGRRGHIGLLGLAAPPVAAVRAGLRLRPRVGAADARPARRDRLAAAPGPRRREQPVPLLPADRRRSDPVGRLRRDPPSSAAGSARSSTGARRRSSKLEAQFFRAFPQLDGLGFPYRWGGAIDTTSRFTVTFGQTLGGRVTYALGYTGLGVGASRWAAGVVRDFILRPDEDRLRLRHRDEPARPVPAGTAPLIRRRDGPPRARSRRPQRGPPGPDPAHARCRRDRVRFVTV